MEDIYRTKMREFPDVPCGLMCCTYGFEECPGYKPKKRIKAQIKALKKQLKELKAK